MHASVLKDAAALLQAVVISDYKLENIEVKNSIFSQKLRNSRMNIDFLQKPAIVIN